ncbi:MAG: hypothetical protein ACJ72C_06400, partial [Nitrososphaeraceae archaeon]
PFKIIISLGLDFVLVICTTEFSTFWKTSGSDEELEEDVDSDDVIFELFDGCDWAAAAANTAILPSDEAGCCSKWISSIYMVFPLRTERESTAATKELTNNICIALNFTV